MTEIHLTDQLNKLRIGYVSASSDMSHPADRRGFCHYAKRRHIRFNKASATERYDIVVVATSADITLWQRLARHTKLVFILSDSYLAGNMVGFREIFRGTAKFLARQHKFFQPNYRYSLKKICMESAAVLCATEEQRELLGEFCSNVHVIFDFHDDVVCQVKDDYRAKKPFKLVWEGLPENLTTFMTIRDVLTELRKRHEIALHIVTDVEYPLGLRHFGKLPTKKLIRKLFDFEEVYLYEWNEPMLATIVTGCDLALIPIPPDVPIFAGKPANKLLLFWRMGVPVVTSATPAYVREMRAAGLDMACASKEEWFNKLAHYISDEDARRETARRGNAYVATRYSEEALLSRWDNLFRTLLR